jgi:hypothetical protein
LTQVMSILEAVDQRSVRWLEIDLNISWLLCRYGFTRNTQVTLHLSQLFFVISSYIRRRERERTDAKQVVRFGCLTICFSIVDPKVIKWLWKERWWRSSLYRHTSLRCALVRTQLLPQLLDVCNIHNRLRIGAACAVH